MDKRKVPCRDCRHYNGAHTRLTGRCHFPGCDCQAFRMSEHCACGHPKDHHHDGKCRRKNCECVAFEQVRLDKPPAPAPAGDAVLQKHRARKLRATIDAWD